MQEPEHMVIASGKTEVHGKEVVNDARHFGEGVGCAVIDKMDRKISVGICKERLQTTKGIVPVFVMENYDVNMHATQCVLFWFFFQSQENREVG